MQQHKHKIHTLIYIKNLPHKFYQTAQGASPMVTSQRTSPARAPYPTLSTATAQQN